MKIAPSISKFLALFHKEKQGGAPQVGGKMRYNFYEDKMYFDTGSEWEDITEEWHKGLINFLTRYDAKGLEDWKTYIFTHEGQKWKIAIKKDD